MDGIFIHGRGALADAADLIDRFGDDAGLSVRRYNDRAAERDTLVQRCEKSPQ